MNNKNYTVADLLKNEFFVNWVLQPNRESDHYWQHWLANHPAEKNTILKARQIIQSLEYQKEDKLNDQEYDEILNSLVTSLRNDKEKSLQSNSNISFFKKYAVAASLFLVAAFITLAIYIIDTDKPTLVAEANNPTLINKSVPLGQKNIIKFIDGSEVKLNSGSEIRFIPGFEPRQRVVSLQGEAYFQIAEDKARPFYIKSGDITVKVTGTAFNVRAFVLEEEVKVAVVSGTVIVESSSGEQANLSKDKMVVYNRELNKIETKDFNYRDEIAWKDGLLIFKQDNITTVLQKLQRWYGIDIILMEKNVKGFYSGEFDNASLEMVLEGISFAYDLQYEIKGKTVELK